MSHNNPASPDDIDPIQIFAAIKRNAVKVLLATLLVGFATFSVLTMMTPRYTSVAQLQFGGQAIVSAQGMDRLRGMSAPDILRKVDKEAVASQVAVIKSRDLALKLIEAIKLNKKPEFNSALTSNGIVGALFRTLGLAGDDPGVSESDRVLTKYDQALRVYQGKDTRVISIQFSASNPALAASGANRLAELYLAGRTTQSVKQSVNVAKWLQPEIKTLQIEVQAAEAKAGDYRAKYNLFAGSRGAATGTLNNEQLSDLTREMTRAQAMKSEADARASAILDLMRRGSANASPDVMKSPLIQRLQDQRVRVERQVSELSATLLPGHPRMRQLRADLGGLKRQIRGEVAKIGDSLDKEAKVAGLRVASIKVSLNKLKLVVRNSGANLAKLNQLERTAKAKRQQLESMQARLQTAIARQRTRAVPLEAELFSLARASTIPTFPKKAPITLLAMAGTLLLGFAVVVTKELLVGARSGGGAPGRGRRASDRADAYLAETALVTTAAPAIAYGGAQAAAVRQDAANLPVVEAVERYAQLSSVDAIGQHLLAHSQGQSGFRTLLTGETAGIDAGDDAIALADALATEGRQVLLLDWSPGGIGLASKLHLNPKPGMTELLLGQAAFENVIHSLPGKDIHFIGAGSIVAPSDSNFDADSLNLILDALDEAYDHIVVYGEHDAARDLFQTIQGRFDAGVSVAEAGGRASVQAEAPGTFLGFEVSDLDIISYQRQVGAAQPGPTLKLSSRVDVIGGARP